MIINVSGMWNTNKKNIPVDKIAKKLSEGVCFC